MRSRPISFFGFLISLGRAWRDDRPLRRQDVRHVILRQIYFTGNQAVRVVVLSAVLWSALIFTQMGASPLDARTSWAQLFIGVLVRELAPLMAVAVVIARSVSATASELATMKSQGEIESLRAAGISPLSYLVIPRMFAGAAATFFLSIYFVVASLVTVFFVLNSSRPIFVSEYLDTLITELTMGDFVIWSFKTLGVGALSLLLSCFYGLSTEGASFEIPQATTRAVMSALFCGLSFQVLSSLFYYLELWR